MGLWSPAKHLVRLGEVDLLPGLVPGDEECVEPARPAPHEVDGGKVGRCQVALVGDPQVSRVLHGDLPALNPTGAVARARNSEGGDGHAELAAEVAANALAQALGEAIDPGIVERHLLLSPAYHLRLRAWTVKVLVYTPDTTPISWAVWSSRWRPRVFTW